MNREQREEVRAKLSERYGLRYYDWTFIGQLHEIAHFVTVFRRKPRCERDFERMQQRLDAMPCGRSQVHETRTSAVELEALRRLGIRYGARRLSRSVWSGIYRADVESPGKGKVVVKSQREVLRRILAHKPSDRVVRALVNTVKDCLREGREDKEVR